MKKFVAIVLVGFACLVSAALADAGCVFSRTVHRGCAGEAGCAGVISRVVHRERHGCAGRSVRVERSRGCANGKCEVKVEKHVEKN